VDIAVLYSQIKEWLRPMVKCPKCEPPSPKPGPIPVSAVFLVDGSDSIRGAQGKIPRPIILTFNFYF